MKLSAKAEKRLKWVFDIHIGDIVRSDLSDDLWFKSWDEMKKVISGLVKLKHISITLLSL